VHEIAGAAADGQFDEWLTSRTARIGIVTKFLISIHHGRIRYPEQRTA
jgi:hypothetical protein